VILGGIVAILSIPALIGLIAWSYKGDPLPQDLKSTIGTYTAAMGLIGLLCIAAGLLPYMRG
jgi:hypothetical protein